MESHPHRQKKTKSTVNGVVNKSNKTKTKRIVIEECDDTDSDSSDDGDDIKRNAFNGNEEASKGKDPPLESIKRECIK